MSGPDQSKGTKHRTVGPKGFSTLSKTEKLETTPLIATERPEAIQAPFLDKVCGKDVISTS